MTCAGSGKEHFLLEIQLHSQTQQISNTILRNDHQDGFRVKIFTLSLSFPFFFLTQIHCFLNTNSTLMKWTDGLCAWKCPLLDTKTFAPDALKRPSRDRTESERYEFEMLTKGSPTHPEHITECF